MKTLLIRILTTIALVALGASHSLYAEDIDVFGGANGAATPDILIIVDNTSSNDAAYASSCPFTGAPANLPASNLLDMVYCALYGAVDAVKSSPQLLGKLSIALMSGGSGSNKGGQFYIPASSPYNPVLMDAGGISTFENAISAGIPKATGNAKLDGDMTEAWAWFTGNTGPRSGTSYSAHIGTLACQKSFIILIGATSKQGRPCNGSGCWSSSDLTTAAWTSAQQTYINTSNLGTATGLDSTSYVDEWARYFNQTDFNNNANDRQNAVMYTITAGSDPHNIPASGTPDYTQELLSAADQGGGKAFSGIDYNSIKNGLLQIFNEVAAVNSVFASSSLPISSNTQGTYQNQVFIGMFRPDANDSPRWLGNLKQYQFGVGGTSANPTLFLADAAGTAAVNAATGFITPTAASFWTAKDTSKLPDNISATGGFWVNDQQGSGAGFDSPDGEVVEKGGVGQQIRLANLQDDYTTAAGTATNPRNVYTCTTGCTTGSSLSATPFATSNTALTTAAFGITGPTSSVSTITRSGNVVTMALTAAPTPALTSGQSVTISGAANAELNGTFAITLVNTTTFTYTITESPPTPSTGTYTASIPATPKTISTLTRSLSGSTWIATATTASAHGFTTGQKVTILGAGQAEYNGQQTITVTGSTTFTYPITPGPGTAVGGGNATDGSGLNPTTISSVTLGTIGSSCTLQRNGDGQDIGGHIACDVHGRLQRHRVQRRAGRLRRHVQDHGHGHDGQRRKQARHVFLRDQYLSCVARDRNHFGGPVGFGCADQPDAHSLVLGLDALAERHGDGNHRDDQPVQRRPDHHDLRHARAARIGLPRELPDWKCHQHVVHAQCSDHDLASVHAERFRCLGQHRRVIGRPQFVHQLGPR